MISIVTTVPKPWRSTSVTRPTEAPAIVTFEPAPSAAVVGSEARTTVTSPLNQAPDMIIEPTKTRTASTMPMTTVSRCPRR